MIGGVEVDIGINYISNNNSNSNNEDDDSNNNCGKETTNRQITLPLIIQRYILQLIWGSSISLMEKLEFGLINSSWFDMVTELYSGCSSITHQFTHNHIIGFKPHILNPYCPLKYIPRIFISFQDDQQSSSDSPPLLQSMVDSPMIIYDDGDDYSSNGHGSITGSDGINSNSWLSASDSDEIFASRTFGKMYELNIEDNGHYSSSVQYWIDTIVSHITSEHYTDLNIFLNAQLSNLIRFNPLARNVRSLHIGCRTNLQDPGPLVSFFTGIDSLTSLSVSLINPPSDLLTNLLESPLPTTIQYLKVEAIPYIDEIPYEAFSRRLPNLITLSLSVSANHVPDFQYLITHPTLKTITQSIVVSFEILNILAKSKFTNLSLLIKDQQSLQSQQQQDQQQITNSNNNNSIPIVNLPTNLKTLHLYLENDLIPLIPMNILEITQQQLQHQQITQTLNQTNLLYSILQSVAYHNHLKSFSLDIGDNNIIFDFNLVSSILVHNKSLKKLSLDILYGKNISMFYECLAANTTLKTLNIYYNKQTPQELDVLKRSLGQNQTIHTLYISHGIVNYLFNIDGLPNTYTIHQSQHYSIGFLINRAM